MSTLWCSSHKIFKNLFCAWECDVKAKCPLKWIEWMFSVLKKIKLKAHFQPWCNARREPISYNMKFPDHWKPFQNRLSQEPSWTYSQLFYGKYIRRSSFYTFFTVFWSLSGRIRRKFFLSVTLRTLWTESAKRTKVIFFHFLETLEDSKRR